MELKEFAKEAVSSKWIADRVVRGLKSRGVTLSKIMKSTAGKSKDVAGTIKSMAIKSLGKSDRIRERAGARGLLSFKSKPRAMPSGARMSMAELRFARKMGVKTPYQTRIGYAAKHKNPETEKALLKAIFGK